MIVSIKRFKRYTVHYKEIYTQLNSYGSTLLLLCGYEYGGIVVDLKKNVQNRKVDVMSWFNAISRKLLDRI